MRCYASSYASCELKHCQGEFKAALPDCFRAAMLALADLGEMFQDRIETLFVVFTCVR